MRFVQFKWYYSICPNSDLSALALWKIYVIIPPLSVDTLPALFENIFHPTDAYTFCCCSAHNAIQLALSIDLSRIPNILYNIFDSSVPILIYSGGHEMRKIFLFKISTDVSHIAYFFWVFLLVDTDWEITRNYPPYSFCWSYYVWGNCIENPLIILFKKVHFLWFDAAMAAKFEM